MILANGQITATVRPNFPWGTQHTNTRDNRKIWVKDRPVPLNHEIPMDWHHMIPWKVLRDGWSALATSGRWEVLTAWTGLWRFDNVPAIATAMRNGVLGAPDNANMWDKLCWAEWNIVEGPHNDHRVAGDDPGSDGLDTFEALGVPRNLRERSQILKSIYTQMKDWLATTHNVSDGQGKALAKDFDKLKPYTRTPIPIFDPRIWEMVSPGRINEFGLADKHPTWKKRP